MLETIMQADEITHKDSICLNKTSLLAVFFCLEQCFCFKEMNEMNR